MVARRVNAERLVVLGWTRAILLQFAHPLIAAGVHDHSGFRASPLAAVKRLRHTVRAMLAITFGTDAERERAISAILAIHRRVNGHLSQQVGPFPAGTRYSAEDPDLVLWVHLTLTESIIDVYERLVAPLTAADRDEYCASCVPVALALGADAALVPHSWNELRAGLERFYTSGVIVVGPDARLLGQAVVRPRGTALAGPATWMNEVLTTGLLPAHIREQYGWRWNPHRERSFAAIVKTLKLARRWLPKRVAHWRDAR